MRIKSSVIAKAASKHETPKRSKEKAQSSLVPPEQPDDLGENQKISRPGSRKKTVVSWSEGMGVKGGRG